jgi:hypothetical protein
LPKEAIQSRMPTSYGREYLTDIIDAAQAKRIRKQKLRSSLPKRAWHERLGES